MGIAWIGILGAAAHGLAAPLVVLFGVEEAAILFPMLTLLALWLVLVAVWPVRAAQRTFAGAEEMQPAEPFPTSD